MAHQIRYLIFHNPRKKRGTFGCFPFLECTQEQLRGSETEWKITEFEQKTVFKSQFCWEVIYSCWTTSIDASPPRNFHRESKQAVNTLHQWLHIRVVVAVPAGASSGLLKHIPPQWEAGTDMLAAEGSLQPQAFPDFIHFQCSGDQKTSSARKTTVYLVSSRQQTYLNSYLVKMLLGYCVFKSHMVTLDSWVAMVHFTDQELFLIVLISD